MIKALFKYLIGSCVLLQGFCGVSIAKPYRWEVVSMGTIWLVDVESDKQIGSNSIEAAISKLLFTYDMSFSDWNNESELRRIEKKGLTTWHTPSKLFMRGLQYSYRANKETNGVFDITVGCLSWKVCKKPIGMEYLDIQGDKFRFKRDPQRLSFGGNVKGMAVAAIAWLLETKEIKHYRVNAGGGNLAYKGKYLDAPNRTLSKLSSKNRVSLVSHSYPYQGKKRHIFDPKKPGVIKKVNISIQCYPASNSEGDFLWGGARADAWSTVLTIDGKLKLPEGCRSI